MMNRGLHDRWLRMVPADLLSRIVLLLFMVCLSGCNESNTASQAGDIARYIACLQQSSFKSQLNTGSSIPHPDTDTVISAPNDLSTEDQIRYVLLHDLISSHQETWAPDTTYFLAFPESSPSDDLMRHLIELEPHIDLVPLSGRPWPALQEIAESNSPDDFMQWTIETALPIDMIALSDMSSPSPASIVSSGILTTREAVVFTIAPIRSCKENLYMAGGTCSYLQILGCPGQSVAETMSSDGWILQFQGTVCGLSPYPAGWAVRQVIQTSGILDRPPSQR